MENLVVNLSVVTAQPSYHQQRGTSKMPKLSETITAKTSAKIDATFAALDRLKN